MVEKKGFDSKAMDDAAEEAFKEFLILDQTNLHLITFAQWWRKWFMTAGHKRLGRKLVAFAKANSPSQVN